MAFSSYARRASADIEYCLQTAKDTVRVTTQEETSQCNTPEDKTGTSRTFTFTPGSVAEGNRSGNTPDDKTGMNQSHSYTGHDERNVVYGLAYECELLPRMTRGSDRRTGYEEVTGQAPDISEWTRENAPARWLGGSY